MRILILGLLLGLLGLSGVWGANFKSHLCYSSGYSYSTTLDSLLENRMPLSLYNFIALLEKYEREHGYTSPDDVAEAIINRYKIDGIIYNPDSPQQWQAKELDEVNKQDLLNKIITPSREVPEDLYEFREECSLHFMTSHSTDTYPHQSVDDLWDNQRRRKRQAPLDRSYLPSGVDAASHPVENGVIFTPYGPVALGTLLSGIASARNSNEQTISAIFGSTEVDYMPQEMKTKKINPQFASTLAGDIGQTAMIGGFTATQNKYYLGSKGMFSNNTAAPRLFTLEDGNEGVHAYLTRAEVFAGIDAMLIQQSLRSSSSSSNSRMTLSKLLRMYYSDRGLPNNMEAKACNRMEAFKRLGIDQQLKEQTLNFMYAFADYFSEARRAIIENDDDFSTIETYFKNALDDAWSAFSSFVSSYSYEDYERCPTYNKNDVKCENYADMAVVYSREGSDLETQLRREYITHLSEMMGVSETGSRLGVMDGRGGNWILEVSNVSNIADWGCNFTMDERQYGGGGSSTDMFELLDKLREYYYRYYKTLNSSAQNSTANSQVVVWNVPKKVPNMDSDNKQKLADFRLDFPNVYFLLVGTSKGSYTDFMVDPENDFFTVSTSDVPEEFAKKLAMRICQIPSVFVYPACNTNNQNFTNYNEKSHSFIGYVSPNYTTYAMIAPHNFRYSPKLTLQIKTSDVRVCTSRKDMDVDKQASDLLCNDDSQDLVYKELCDRYLEDCDPIYLKITTLNVGNPVCSDEECKFPNQVKYEIDHEGMQCGAWSPSVSLMMLTLAALFHRYVV